MDAPYNSSSTCGLRTCLVRPVYSTPPPAESASFRTAAESLQYDGSRRSTLAFFWSPTLRTEAKKFARAWIHSGVGFVKNDRGLVMRARAIKTFCCSLVPRIRRGNRFAQISRTPRLSAFSCDGISLANDAVNQPMLFS